MSLMLIRSIWTHASCLNRSSHSFHLCCQCDSEKKEEVGRKTKDLSCHKTGIKISLSVLVRGKESASPLLYFLYKRREEEAMSFLRDGKRCSGWRMK